MARGSSSKQAPSRGNLASRISGAPAELFDSTSLVPKRSRSKRSKVVTPRTSISAGKRPYKSSDDEFIQDEEEVDELEDSEPVGDGKLNLSDVVCVEFEAVDPNHVLTEFDQASIVFSRIRVVVDPFSFQPCPSCVGDDSPYGPCFPVWVRYGRNRNARVGCIPCFRGKRPCLWSKDLHGVLLGPSLDKGDLSEQLWNERAAKDPKKKRKIEKAIASTGSIEPPVVLPTQASRQVVNFNDLTRFERAVDNSSLSLATMSGFRLELRSERAREKSSVAALVEILALRMEHMDWLVDRFDRRIRALDDCSAEVAAQEIEGAVEDDEEKEAEEQLVLETEVAQSEDENGEARGESMEA